MAKITQAYNLQVINPSLAEQWHPTKNGSLTQKDVFPKSGKKVWWICDKGHEWEAFVRARNHGTGCPYCSGGRLCVIIMASRLLILILPGNGTQLKMAV